MRVVDIDRSTLAELIQNPNRNRRLLGRPSSTESGLFIRKNSELRAIWTDGDDDLPVALLTGQRTQRDLVAWCVAHFSSIRPFTSLIRIMEDKEFDQLLKLEEHQPSLNGMGSGSVGLILCEAFAYSESRMDRWMPTLNMCTSTFSFAASRHLALTQRKDLEALYNSWRYVCNASGLARDNLDPQSLLEPVLILSQLSSSRRPKKFPVASGGMLDSCERIVRGEELSEEAIRDALQGTAGPRVSHIAEFMKSKREERVLCFEGTAERIMRSRKNERVRAFAIAFMASMINPGSLDHFALIAPYTPKLPSTLLWYGILAGIHPNNRILEYGNGLGYRVWREVMRRASILDRPTADIALPELMITDGPEADLRTQTSGVLTVELSPRVNTTVRWGGKDRGRNEISNVNDEVRIALLEQLRFLIASGRESNQVLRELQREIEAERLR